MPLPVDQIQRIAGLELNALRATDVLGVEYERARISPRGTPIYDVNGTILYYRLPLRRGRTASGYVDIAVDEAFGEPFLSTTMSLEWNERELREAGAAKAREVQPDIEYNRVRFVAYSFPKIALQFLSAEREVLMLELYSWAKVPPLRPRGGREPSDFERWSFIDEMPAQTRQARQREFETRRAVWDAPALRRIDPSVITKEAFDLSEIVVVFTDTREIHYSPRADDHHPCYELRGQQTPVWCVPASVEMLLNFYRYQYDQPRLADELEQGTCDKPLGLPYGEEHRVVDTIEKLSSNTLDATAIANPVWNDFQTEIRANRPLISFIPGHSRTVAGYTRSMLHLPGQLPFRGLLVYDPWPPTDCAHPEAGGVITKWENFATQIYRYAFTAVLKHV